MDRNTKIVAIGIILSGIGVIAAVIDHNNHEKAGSAAVERVKASTYAFSSYNGICGTARPDDTNNNDQGLLTDGVYCGRNQAILTVAVQEADRTNLVFVIADQARPDRASPTITARLPDQAYGF